MPWQELIGRRIRAGRTYRDDQEPTRLQGHFTLAPLHYETSIGSGLYDAPVDCRLARVTGAALDGWRIVANGFHYALGHPGDKAADGWIGHGGRQGQNWLRFRLLRAGYLHGPSRAWQDVGGAPAYDRARLVTLGRSKLIGPNPDEAFPEGLATWSGIWSTPGEGDLSISWRVNGDQLKEQIAVNQAARTWIAANRPPATNPSETYFGFVFDLDWTDVPRVFRGAVLQDLEGDFDDQQQLELRDDANRLLALLPADQVAAGIKGRAAGGLDVAPLQKRFWRDADGHHYMLAGVRCDLLAAMRPGPLAFDPTFDIANTNRDAFSETAAGAVENENVAPSEGDYGAAYLGYENPGFTRLWDGGWIFATTIDDNPTINTCTVLLRYNGDTADTVNGSWYGYLVSAPADFAAAHTHRVSDHETRTTASAADSFSGAANHTSPSLAAILQEIVDQAGVGANPTVGLTYRATGSGGYWAWVDYTDSAANSADLAVTWTAGGGGGLSIPVAVATYRRRRT
jgi:hypothetical protein